MEVSGSTRRQIISGLAAVGAGLAVWRLLASRIGTPRLDFSWSRTAISRGGGAAAALVTLVASRALIREEPSRPVEALSYYAPEVVLEGVIDDARLEALATELTARKCLVLSLDGPATYTLEGLRKVVASGVRGLTLDPLFIDQHGGPQALWQTLRANVSGLLRDLPEGHETDQRFYQAIVSRPQREILRFIRTTVTPEHMRYIVDHLLTLESREATRVFHLMGGDVQAEVAGEIVQLFPNLTEVAISHSREMTLVDAFADSHVEVMHLPSWSLVGTRAPQLPATLKKVYVSVADLDRHGSSQIKAHLQHNDIEVSVWVNGEIPQGGPLSSLKVNELFGWLSKAIDREDKSRLDLRGYELTQEELEWVHGLLPSAKQVRAIQLDGPFTRVDWDACD